MKIIHAGILIVICMIVIYGGIVIYGNVSAMNDNPYSVPDSSKAAYSIRIKNTGLTFFAQKTDKDGSIITMRDKYWELIDGKYKLRHGDLPLDEDIFGPIEMRKRS